ncbi:hypothetical protein DH2020_036961 [Rehmannia glutinosa]|uniref:Amino acid transporter transmembrane domain-containing protein n=1 Tax=Rehmannia glutinosa TaxID=99300 RepID=A0ABR0V573_REHGL
MNDRNPKEMIKQGKMGMLRFIKLCSHGNSWLLNVRFGSKFSNNTKFSADKVSTKVAIYAIIASPVAKFALMLLPIVKDVENQLMRRPNRGISILLRSGLVISSIVVALIFPLFGYLMTLVGAFFDIALSIILSCVFYMKITKRYLYGFESISMWGIVVVGVLVLSLGTFQATWDIVKHFTG